MHSFPFIPPYEYALLKHYSGYTIIQNHNNPNNNQNNNALTAVILLSYSEASPQFAHFRTALEVYFESFCDYVLNFQVQRQDFSRGLPVLGFRFSSSLYHYWQLPVVAFLSQKLLQLVKEVWFVFLVVF